MKRLNTSLIMTVLLAMLAVAMFSCSDDDAPSVGSPELVTATGVVMTLDGRWSATCVEDLGMNLSETLTFDGESIVVDILLYQDVDCATQVGSDRVDITFEAGGTIEVQLDGSAVTANKISGLAVDSDGDSESFRQIIYVDDRDGELKLYHGRFDSDGGGLTADGYPSELIPIAIVKE